MISMISIGEQLTAALSAVWRAIERRHPDVPPAVLALGAAEADRLCQVAENRWPHWAADEAVVVHRLFVGPAVLRQDAQGVLENLLHMAAHGLAAARGISDTSRRGQYHNKQYRELAEEVGLTVDDADTRGWDDTSMRESTGDAYAVEERQLDVILGRYAVRRHTHPVLRADSTDLVGGQQVLQVRASLTVGSSLVALVEEPVYRRLRAPCAWSGVAPAGGR
jgi:hypothetical protein